MKKPFYKSKTVIFNAILLILSIFDKEFFLLLGIEPNAVAIINALIIKVTAAGNIILRTVFTKGEIENPID
jgi:hypothetical protein